MRNANVPNLCEFLLSVPFFYLRFSPSLSLVLSRVTSLPPLVLSSLFFLPLLPVPFSFFLSPLVIFSSLPILSSFFSLPFPSSPRSFLFPSLPLPGLSSSLPSPPLVLFSSLPFPSHCSIFSHSCPFLPPPPPLTFTEPSAHPSLHLLSAQDSCAV